MTWKASLVTALRFYIGDIDLDSPIYTNLQLEKFIAIAATYVTTEIEFSNTYSIDLDVPSITPDPVITSDNPDSGIGSLFVAKAACIIARAELRKSISKYGLRIKDDVTDFDGRVGGGLSKDTAQSFCESYEKIKNEWEMGNRPNGLAIFGPYADFYSREGNYSPYNRTGNRHQ